MVEEPSLDGYGDVCSQASAELCLSTCEVRIGGVDTLCASCLLEGASFAIEDTVLIGDQCDGQTCTMNGRVGTCTYPQGNEDARKDCMRQVYPRREVACEAEFRPVTECAAVCGSGGA